MACFGGLGAPRPAAPPRRTAGHAEGPREPRPASPAELRVKYGAVVVNTAPPRTRKARRTARRGRVLRATPPNIPRAMRMCRARGGCRSGCRRAVRSVALTALGPTHTLSRQTQMAVYSLILLVVRSPKKKKGFVLRKVSIGYQTCHPYNDIKSEKMVILRVV